MAYGETRDCGAYRLVTCKPVGRIEIGQAVTVCGSNIVRAARVGDWVFGRSTDRHPGGRYLCAVTVRTTWTEIEILGQMALDRITDRMWFERQQVSGPACCDCGFGTDVDARKSVLDGRLLCPECFHDECEQNDYGR